MRILADVDTGIDDACALLYLCGLDDVELAAVTTTSGNTTAWQSALNTLAVLDAAGRPDVPVAAGTPVPLVRPLVTTPETHGPGGVGYAALPDLRERLSPRPWLELWREEFTTHPGTTLLVTGPLTNLAVALDEFPELVHLVGAIVIMGGCFWHLGNTTPTAEWNTWVDPDAAKRVYAAFEGLPTDRLPIVCATETTERIEYRPDLLDRLLGRCRVASVEYTATRDRCEGPQADTGNPALDLLCDALRFYFEFHQDYDQGYIAHLHDLFAAMVAAGRTDVRWQETVVDVEAGSDLLRGTTVRDDRGIWGRRPNARVVVANQPQPVFDEFSRSLAVLAGAEATTHLGDRRLPGPASAPVGRLTQLVLECADAPALARFYQEVLALQPPHGSPDWLTLDWDPVGRLSFHTVAGYQAPPWPGSAGEQQVHLDLLVPDLEAATERVLTAGARPLGDVLNPGPTAWRIFADPAGHPFCLVSTPE